MRLYPPANRVRLIGVVGLLAAASVGVAVLAGLSPRDRLARAILGRHFDRGQVAVRIEKSKYRLTLVYRGRPVRAYPVVFGRNPVDDKLREGDGCTPEGVFHVVRLYPHRLWRRFLLLDYPTADTWRKHREVERRHRIRTGAALGGAIGIHGVPEGKDAWIADRRNWTLGCISMRNADVEQVYAVCRKGTVVTIVH